MILDAILLGHGFPHSENSTFMVGFTSSTVGCSAEETATMLRKIEIRKDWKEREWGRKKKDIKEVHLV